jgi:hypothetical protein
MLHNEGPLVWEVCANLSIGPQLCVGALIKLARSIK